MKKGFVLLLFSILFFSCKTIQVSEPKFFTNVKIDTLLREKISIRPITVSLDKVWYAAEKIELVL